MNNTLKKLLAPIASLRLTVVLLALSMVVILAGTTAQEHMGIWQVQEKFFHSWVCKIDLDLLAPLVRTHVPGAIPMLGGYSLIVLLLANLLTAHALRFKVSPWDIVLLPLLGFLLAVLWAWQSNHSAWLMALACVVSVGFIAGLFAVHKKRGGVILIHLGLILLLVGELVTSLVAVESRMTIDEGRAASYSFDIREPELALVDKSGSGMDKVYAIDDGRLSAGNVIDVPEAQVQVKVERYFRNADLLQVGTPKAAGVDVPAVTDGAGKQWVAAGRSGFTGVGDDSSAVDMPAVYVTLSKGGQTIGTYLGSVELPTPQTVTIDGKPYGLSLRFRRYYLPYRLELQDFRFDRYVGTNTPKNYSSLVRLVDPHRNEDREILISMNNPLRHAGLTFFQADFDKRTEKTTVLQVVRNPGWLLPYVSCVIGGIGMTAHFGIVLVNFLRKRAKQSADSAAAAAAAGLDAQGKPRATRGAARGESYTLQPRRNWPAVIFSLVVGAIAAVYLLGVVTRSPKATKPFDLNAFSQIPISFGGRQQPLDSIARNHLKVISGREEFKDKDGNKQPAIRWLLDMFTRQAGDHKVIRIDHSGIKSILAQHLPPPSGNELAVTERKLFSFMELSPALAELNRQVDLAGKVEQRDRDLFQNKVIALSRQFQLAMEAGMLRDLFFVPPTKPGEEWRSVGAAFDASNGDMATVSPYVASLFTILNAYTQNDPATFNAEVARYRARVQADVPAVVAKTDFETRYNVAAPFVVSMVLYIGVFLLAVGSWLGWREPLRRGAFALLVVTLVFHTLALVGRMYISGRPPVTNLYSSAIFIAWGTALLAVLLEMVYRNGIGSVTAAVTAFPSLLIAHYLSFDGNGDTMQVLQAVLDTNFWLATHVVAITLGYAATFLAGFLGIVFVVLGIGTPTLREDATRKAIARMTYGILCFGVLFSFVGTVLGGIWADQSWGRFWGWDPKENGAVLIVLWNAVILHARWGGLVRERGLAVLSIFGNIVTAWSWFGTNMLGVGLHSYGFMDSAVTWLALFVFSQLALILLGAVVPQRLWWSFRPVGPQGRGFDPGVK